MMYLSVDNFVGDIVLSRAFCRVTAMFDELVSHVLSSVCLCSQVSVDSVNRDQVITKLYTKGCFLLSTLPHTPTFPPLIMEVFEPRVTGTRKRMSEIE